MFSTPDIYALSGKYFRTTLRRFRQVNYIIYTGISGQNRNVINEKNVLRKADPHCSMVQKLKTGEDGSYLTILAEKRCVYYSSKNNVYLILLFKAEVNIRSILVKCVDFLYRLSKENVYYHGVSLFVLVILYIDWSWKNVW